MRRIFALATVLLWLGAAGSVHAQATRTWVSGVGDDANPCSRAAPCKTFAGAISKTAAGGEIDALDSGGFGTVTITKAITLDGGTALAGVLVSGTNGIIVAAGATDVVILRRLSLHGNGTQSGVLFTSGAALHIEDCVVTGFNEGVDFEPALGGQLFLLRVASRGNADAGVLIRSGGAGNSFATLSDVHLEGNGVGLLAGAGTRVDVYDSVASGNSGAGVSSTLDGAGGTAEVNLQGVTVSHNGTGVLAAAAAGTSVVRMSQVLGTANATAPTAATGSGSILTFGDNRLDIAAALALSSSAPSQQVTAGAPAGFPIDVAVTGLVAGPISFACTGLPAGAACSFIPDTLAAGVAQGMVTVTVTTSGLAIGGATTGWPRLRTPPLGPLLLLLLPLLCALALAARGARKPWPLRGAAAAIILGLALGEAACSERENWQGAAATPSPGPSTYPFQVTATAGAISASVPLTLIVN